MDEKMVEALRVINEECRKHPGSCAGCPLYMDIKLLNNGCMLDISPEYWRIVK